MLKLQKIVNYNGVSKVVGALFVTTRKEILVKIVFVCYILPALIYEYTFEAIYAVERGMESLGFPVAERDSSWYVDNTEESHSHGMVGISDGEIVVFDETSDGVFHGHVRSWNELSEEMKAVLRKAGLVTKKGKIINK